MTFILKKKKHTFTQACKYSAKKPCSSERALMLILFPEYKSAFAIYGVEPIQTSAGVMTVPSRGVVTNIGQHYSPVTGEYTAPYPGIYVFVLNIYKESTASSSVYCYIRRNGHNVALANVPTSTSGYHEGSAATVLHLSRGDKVYVGGCSSVDDLDDWTSFIGFLLKSD